MYNYAAKSKSEVDELNIERLKKVPSALISLKSKVDKLDAYKLKHVPVDFKKLSDVADNDVVKKTVYDELVKKVNTIDTRWLVRKTN